MSRLSFRQRDALPSHASYSGEKRSASGGSQPDGEMVTVNALPSSEVGEQPQRKGAVSSTYDSLSWMMGFREKYTLACFWVFGGALLGFCLARSTMLNPSNVRTETTAGEYFWFDRPKWGHNYLIHIYLTIIGGILVGLQGLPGIRRRYMLLHRINGYIVVACLFIGNISGSIIARHAYGGDLNIQMPYYLMGILIVGSGSIGLYNVKRETRRHRAWMLRMVAYFCAPITTKIVMSITREVITKIGNYYAVWRCDEMLYVMKDRAVAESMWPQCFSGVDPGTISIAIRASTKVADAALKKVSLASSTRVSQGMSLWLGLLVHIVGIEIFLRLTDEANQKRYGYVLESNNYDGEAQGEELWVYNK